jgi:hypothetical protein
MFVFAIKCLLGILLIIWAILMFVEIFKKKPALANSENNILHVKEHMDVFGCKDGEGCDEDFERNKEIIVLSPEQIGLNSTGGGTY